MINTTHLLERSTISFYQPSSIGSKKNRKRNNQNRSIKRPAMHVMNRVFKIKIVYPKDILPKYKCVCVFERENLTTAIKKDTHQKYV